MPLDDLYREVILDHYKNPRNTGTLEDPTWSVDLNNPLCGDEILVQAQLEDGRIKAIRFQGRGCSISQASASMMTELLTGKTVSEAETLIDDFKQMIQGKPHEHDLGDLEALQGVSRYPVRIKCATLSWNAVQKGISMWKGESDESGTDSNDR